MFKNLAGHLHFVTIKRTIYASLFNTELLLAREQRIMTMLETIRVYISERFKSKGDEVEKWKYPIYRKIMNKIEVNINLSSTCSARHSGGIYMKYTLNSTKSMC